MKWFWIGLAVVIVVLIIIAIYTSNIKAATTEDIKDKDIGFDVTKFGYNPNMTLPDILPTIKYNKNDIIIAKNNTVLYTVPPRNISERDKYRMSNPKKGANIGWYHSDHGTEFGTFYSKVTINLNGAFKEFYMPKRDIKIK